MSVALPFLIALALSWALTGLMVLALRAPSHMQVPTARGMHHTPTPVGAGLALVMTLCVVLWMSFAALPRDIVTLLTATMLLSLVSALDHYRPIWPLTRLAVQMLCISITLSYVPDTSRFVVELPMWVERTAIAFAWLWLVNLTNFMDGIDGLACAESVAVAIGIAALLSLQSSSDGTTAAILSATLAGACLGVLVWNWSPARIFLGDAGSVPIGFMLGWLLLQLAFTGAWAAAAVLPILFVADATVTLLRRILTGQAPWRPHRTHYYQQAALGGASAPEIVGLLTVCNVALIWLALWATHKPLPLLMAGTLIALLFLFILAQRGRQTTPDVPPQRPLG